MSRRTAARRLVPAAVAALLCVGAGMGTVRPDVDGSERTRLAERFGFERVLLNAAPARDRDERVVAPGLEGIRGWISAVGAAVGLTDLRGLGRAADACLVDPRDDTVTVLPVPGAGGPDYPRFTLTPQGLPYDSTMAPMGCVPADVNADGAMDVTVYYWGRSPVMFLGSSAADPAPSAADFRPAELVSPMQVWNSTALAVADADGDGEVDVLVGNYFPDGARVLDPSATQDDRMRMQHSMGRAGNAGPNRLFLATPTGEPQAPPRLADASTPFPDRSARSWTLAFGLQDLTGDLRPEIYVANDFGPDQLLVNDSESGHPRFEAVEGDRDLLTPRSQVLGHDSFKGMGVAYTYGSGDELPSIAVSNITTPYALHESNFLFVPDGDGSELLRGTLPFTERSEELGIARSGWSWDIKAADFDNAGGDELLQATGFLKGEENAWPRLQELAMGNDALTDLPAAWPDFEAGDDVSGHEHNPFWVRAEDGRYTDLAAAVGIGHPDVSRGLAVGDVDGDSRLDVLVANQWEDSVLLQNTGSGTGAAADLRIVRPGGGGELRDLIGARLDWTTRDGPQRLQLYPSNGHAGVSAPAAHLALPGGEATEVEISWRDATGTRSTTVRVGPGHQTVLINPDGTATLR